MIPNNSAVADIESNMVGEEMGMIVDAEDLVHLMGVLSNLYTDPTGAVAREYITNARDSHVQAGQTRPVEVTLPNAWQSNLIIQDFGIGMSRDDIDRVFRRYGKSTKRHSNEYNGMIGIGSKSAYAYSGSFTITGVKNGVSVVAVAERDLRGAPLVKIIDERKTDEPNGVTITIPVSDQSRMAQAVKNVARFMAPGELLVNGQDLSERHNWTLIESDIEDDDGNVLILNLWKHAYNGGWGSRGDRKVIMGGVAYEMTDASYKNIDIVNAAEFHIYAEVPNGSVVFAPNREKLQDVRLTLDVERFILDKYNKLSAKQMYESIVNAESRFKALQQYHANRGMLQVAGYKNIKYKGAEIPPLSRAVIPYRDDYTLVGWSMDKDWNNRNRVYSSNNFSYSAFVNASIVIMNAPNDGLTTTNRRKANQYVERNGLGGPNKKVIIIPERTDDFKRDWLDTVHFVEYEEITKEKLPRAPRAKGGTGISTKGKHFVYNSDKGDYELREIEDDETLFYMVKSDFNKEHVLANIGFPYHQRNWEYFSKRVDGLIDGNLVHVYANRKDKFVKDYPDATELTTDSLRGMIVDEALATVTDDDILNYAYSQTAEFVYPVSTVCMPDEDADAVLARKIIRGNGADTIQSIVNYIDDDHELHERIERATAEVEALGARLLTRYEGCKSHSFVYYAGEDLVKHYFRLDYERYLKEQENNDSV